MAEFSKQYCDKYDPDMGWDFDIEEMAKELGRESCIPMICEGFGSIWIGKNTEGLIELGFSATYKDEVKWVLLSEVNYNTYMEIWKKK